MSLFSKLLTPEEEGQRVGDFQSITRRDHFSRWLPYLAYHDEDETYLNGDDTLGKIWECLPLPFLSDKSAEYLAGIFSREYPRGTVISFMLYPDDNIDPVMSFYRDMKKRGDTISVEAARRYADYILDSKKGMKDVYGIPTRNFRLLVSVKSHEPLSQEEFLYIEECLQSSGLAPRNMGPEDLLDFMRRLFNEQVPANSRLYDRKRYLRAQIIQSETEIMNRGDTIWLGTRPVGCLTPKSMSDVDALGINCLIGGFRGMEDDSRQLSQKFIWTCSVFFRTSESEVRKKSSVMMPQRVGGSLSKDLARRVEELGWVLDDISRTSYCDVIASFLVIGNDEKDLSRGLARARNLWESGQCKFVMQRESRITHAMLIASLPFGLYTGKNFSNLDTLDRDFPMSSAAAARMLPIQSDFAGRMNPAMVLVGRKGQLVTVDVFEPGAINHNLLICAGSGAGKSFFTNFLASNYYGLGALIRLVDIGYSYEKQCLIRKGRFIDIGDHAHKLVLNPFQMGGGDDLEDQSANRSTVAQIVLAMIYSSTGTSKVSETQITLCKQGVDFAYERDGGEFGVDHVFEFLHDYPKDARDDMSGMDATISMAHEMSFNLLDWTSKGQYGAMFNGQSTFDISSDDFVVLEMERLITNVDLFGVVSLQVMNAITNDLYLSDRSQRRFMLFDEAWKYLVMSSQGSSASGNSATGVIAEIIQEGYRRARKYGGATGVVTQSPLDLEKMGKAGEVIKGNSAFKFWLQSDREEWELASKRDIVSYSGLSFELASSVRNHRPHYSEVFMETPFGSGVGRLSVDPWTYWVNTSDAREFAQFKDKLSELDNDSLAAITALAEGS